MRKHKIRSGTLCPELAAVLRAELAMGNSSSGPPEVTDWPEEGSVFATLRKDFLTDVKNPPANVRYSVCNDPHYGWFGEYYCEIHKHLLVAGACKHGAGR